MCAAEPGGGGEGAAGGWTGGEEASRPQEPERSPCPARQDQETEGGPKASDGCFGNPVFGELRGKSPSCKEAVPSPPHRRETAARSRSPVAFPALTPPARGGLLARATVPLRPACQSMTPPWALSSSSALRPPEGSSWPVRLAPLQGPTSGPRHGTGDCAHAPRGQGRGDSAWCPRPRSASA